MDIASAARLLLLAAIWGGSFLFMRIGAPVFGAGLLAELRVGVAALFLWGVCRWLRRRLHVRAHWRHYLVIGLLNSALPFLMFAYAAQPFARTLPAPASPTTLDWAAVIARGAICTGFAYLLYFRLIIDVGPMRALSVTFLIPVFGVLWGVIFLDEDVNLKTLLGGALVLLGTALANGVLKARRAEDTRS